MSIDRIPRQIFRFSKKFPLYVCIVFLPENSLTLRWQNWRRTSVLSNSDFFLPAGWAKSATD